MIIRKQPYRLIVRGTSFRLGRMGDSTVAAIARNGWREVASWNHEPTDAAVQQAGAKHLQEQPA